MARTKVRNYPTREQYENEIKEYMISHRGELIEYMLRRLGYEDVDTLREDEYSMKFGFDCGWVQLHPKNKEMSHEWYLDNGKINDYIFDIANCVYSTQSITIKQPIVEKTIEDMGLESEFYIIPRLD